MHTSIQRGFTLIELLVVVAIISILSGIVFASLQLARVQGRAATTIAQLRHIKTATGILQIHTGKSIRGCPIVGNSGISNEIILSDPDAGLHIAPTSLVAAGPCQWTTATIAEWKGPYIRSPLDPWGNAYWYDPDYHPRRDGGACDTYPGDPEYPVLVSGGPNGQNGAAGVDGPYDCDDIFLILEG